MSKTAAKNIKLIYFDGRGRAEHIRLILAYAGIKFEDKRIGFGDWPALKPNTPWGSLPVLEVNGKSIGQSVTLGRYVAHEAGIAGKDNFEQARCDSAVDTIIEMREMFVQWAFAKDDKDALQKKMDETLPGKLDNLEKFLGKDKFFGGSQISWADLVLFAVYEGISALYDTQFKQHKGLTNIVDAVRETPNVKKYLASRPETQF